MKQKRLLLSALALAVTPAIVAPIQADAEEYSKTFKDIPRQHVYYDIIHSMANQGIISGFEDGTFKPSETISRKHAAALINRYVDLPPEITETEYKQPNDLSIDNPYYENIKTLLKAGALELDANGNINPNKPLTRGEMAKILYLAFGLYLDSNRSFPDVSFKYGLYANILYTYGITTGYEDGTFKENNLLTRAHFAVFMYRAMHIEDKLTKEQLESLEARRVDSEQQRADRVELTDEEKKYINIAEKIISFNKDISEFPRPEGITVEEQEAKQIEIRVREKHNMMGGGFYFFIKEAGVLEKGSMLYNVRGESIGEWISIKAKQTGITVQEFIDIINKSIITGEVYDGGNFSLYYDYEKAGLSYSQRTE